MWRVVGQLVEVWESNTFHCILIQLIQLLVSARLQTLTKDIDRVSFQEIHLHVSVSLTEKIGPTNGQILSR